MRNPLINALRLASSKKGLSRKIIYLLQGIIFTPFLVYEEKKQRKEGQALDSNQAGDDVYPLF